MTDFVPELAQAVNAGTAGDEINTTQWEDISIGALASYMAGIARNSKTTALLFDVAEANDCQSRWSN
jgi:hypothetical protein